MSYLLSQETDERVAVGQTPHLSYSRLNRYLLCPEQYRLYYVENLRPRIPAASLVFGHTMHRALAASFADKADPVAFFQTAWQEVQAVDLRFILRESWDKLYERGQALLKKFAVEEAPRIREVHASEKVFELTITNLDLPFIGVIDLVAEVDAKLTVVDFKTSASSYEDHEVALSDQLTAYHLAEPKAVQSALCVLVKTKEPRIDWYFSQRNGEQFTEFLVKAERLGQDIANQRFYKRPGKWCAWCDYLPVCLGDKQQAEESLVQAA